jgi:acetyl-CoA synthetase (ADP-forming)
MQVARAAHPDKLFVVLSRTTDPWSLEWEAAVRENGIPFLQGYGRGPQALGRLARYSRFVHGMKENPAQVAASASVDLTQPLDEIESKKILAEAGVPVVETAMAATADEAVKLAERMGYPVALKVVAPEITHKSAAGGVRLGLADDQAVQRAFGELKDVAAGAQANFRGVAVQPMAAPGTEIVLGAQNDPQFGPVVMCGLGGVFVEVLNSVALKLAPVKLAEADAMLDEFRGGRLLEGLDRPALAQAIVSLSNVIASRADIRSVDVNPVFVYKLGIVAVDARVQLA